MTLTTSAAIRHALVVALYTTDEFGHWLESVVDEDRAEAKSIDRVVELLKLQGVRLGYPHSSDVRGTKHAIRELRPRRGASRFRAFYAFDPVRDAILLLGGSKTEDLYGRVLARAIALWEEHLREVRTRLEGEARQRAEVDRRSRRLGRERRE